MTKWRVHQPNAQSLVCLGKFEELLVKVFIDGNYIKQNILRVGTVLPAFQQVITATKFALYIVMLRNK